MKGIEGTKLYGYMARRINQRGVERIEGRVSNLYHKLAGMGDLDCGNDEGCSNDDIFGFQTTYGVMEWLKSVVTVEQLGMEFNEHELMELLQE